MKITSTENIFTDFFCDRITILSALANNVKKKKQTNEQLCHEWLGVYRDTTNDIHSPASFMINVLTDVLKFCLALKPRLNGNRFI